jgi:hypothetical protein
MGQLGGEKKAQLTLPLGSAITYQFGLTKNKTRNVLLGYSY